MTRVPKQGLTMCCVEIGHIDLLVPAEDGLKLVKLLQSAHECDKRYTDRRYVYALRAESLEISLQMVKPSQILAPRELRSPSAPLLLGDDS